MNGIDSALTGVVGGAIGARTTGARGPRGPRGKPGRQGPPGVVTPDYPFQGRFFDESRIQLIYVSTTGNDSTGNGQSPAAAYATVQRALRDFPDGWTADVWIIVRAGTYGGNQTWTMFATPGYKTTTTGTGRVAIVGDMVTGAVSLTGGVAGAAVAGTLSQFRYAVGAYAPVVTNGSHFLWEAVSPANWLLSTRAVLASTSPNLDIQNSSNAALTNPRLSPWNTNFTGSVNINLPTYRKADSTHWFAVYAIRFQSGVTAYQAQFRGVRFDTTFTGVNTSCVGCVVMSATTTLTGVDGALSTFSSGIVVAGTLSLQGIVNTIASVSFLGAAAGAAKLCLGGTSATLNSTITPATVRQFLLCDFRGTGLAVMLRAGSRLLQGGTSAACTCAVTGGAGIVLDSNSVAYGGATWTWTGTSDTGATLENVSHLLTSGGYTITTGGATDIKVGDLASTAVAVRPQTDPDQLCRYT